MMEEVEVVEIWWEEEEGVAVEEEYMRHPKDCRERLNPLLDKSI